MTWMSDIARGRSWRGAPVLALGLAVAATGCGSLLDVNNPNNVNATDTENPVAARSLVNGALGSVSYAVTAMGLLTGTATDEFDWSGSRDGWNQLALGNVHNPYNEFTDGDFPYVAEARWLANDAVTILEKHLANNALTDKTQMARAYLVRAIIYTSIADQFDDWALSNKDSAVAPVGKANMLSFYDTAVSDCDAGLAIAGISATLKLQLTAMKARAQFSKSIRVQIHPDAPGTPIAIGAVANAAAAATAAQALALVPSPDWKFQFQYGSGGYGTDYRGWILQRQEMRIGAAYAAPDPSGKPTWANTVLRDPISNAIDPSIDAQQKAFKASSYPAFTITSAREMHLIIAENELATNGGTAAFAAEINAIRVLDDTTAAFRWNQAAPQVPALTILTHERRISLFMQGRRLADHYRFATGPTPTSNPAAWPSTWLPSSDAYSKPGTLLPISAAECLSNPYIGAANCGK